MILFGVIDIILGTLSSETGYGILWTGFGIISLPPLWAVSIRRLHDTNKSGWVWFITFIPFVNFALLFIYCEEGTQGINRFGENPKEFLLNTNESFKLNKFILKRQIQILRFMAWIWATIYFVLFLINFPNYFFGFLVLESIIIGIAVYCKSRLQKIDISENLDSLGYFVVFMLGIIILANILIYLSILFVISEGSISEIIIV
tara:strand:- start:136 stop:744 length:609 start_codon:yes stop_codon:yes gene_type:complete